MDMVDVQNLIVKYKDLTAVDGVTLHVARGEIFGVIGPNGAGKTSMIECMEGLRQPCAGRIRVADVDPRDRRKLYRHIGVQLQESSFPDAIRVGELCRLFSSFYERPADYRMLLERFGLEGRERAFYKKLSGGQKQKISVVLALIADPQVVFLDELTTGLDPKSRIDMWELVKSLRDAGKTVFLTTHFMEEAEYLCDRVCMLVAGKVAAMGTVAELAVRANLDQKIAFLTDSDVAPLNALPGVNHVERQGNRVMVFGKGKNLLRDVVVAMSEQEIGFEELSYKKPDLEDVFLKLTGSGLEGM